MAAGLCVVATEESGLPIRDGVNGLIVPAKDANAIVEKLEWLSLHREKINDFGIKAYSTIRDNFSWEKYAENTLKVYEELMKCDHCCL